MGRRISLVSGEDREPQFLFQRISVAIQRSNAVLLHDGFFCLPTTRINAAPHFNFLHYFFSSSGRYLPRLNKIIIRNYNVTLS